MLVGAMLQGLSVSRQRHRLVLSLTMMMNGAFNVSGWSRVGFWLGLIVLAVVWAYEGNLEQWIGRLFHVVSHVMFHVTFAAAAPPFCVLCVLLWLGLFCFGLVSQGSSCRLLFWLSFSRDMTATVLSNAALEEKKLWTLGNAQKLPSWVGTAKGRWGKGCRASKRTSRWFSRDLPIRSRSSSRSGIRR